MALAENVRDYAIFLMDPNGIITFWGEGARLIKWWTRDQAEGGHLRMLYPAGGSDDGTAEAHLRAAAERGEYTGEGQRIRSDGSTFWAGITITALSDDAGTLLGFAKVTRDLTARRAADALLQAAAEAADAARADAVAASAAKSGFLAAVSRSRPGSTGTWRGRARARDTCSRSSPRCSTFRASRPPTRPSSARRSAWATRSRVHSSSSRRRPASRGSRSAMR